MKTELTKSTKSLNRKDIKALITSVLNSEKVLSDKINGPVFRAGVLYIQFRSDCLHIRTVDIKWMVTLPYKNIERIAVESDECGELYLLILARDGLRVILDESAVSFTAEAARQVLEEYGGNDERTSEEEARRNAGRTAGGVGWNQRDCAKHH